MKKATTLIMAALAMTALFSCKGNKHADDGAATFTDSLTTGTTDIPMCQITVGPKTYNVADIDDSARVYNNNVERSRCFIVISKKEYRLYVYEVSADQKDTLLAAHFPVCYAKYPEAKAASGDMRTPESTMQEPFTISQIQDASDWHHDFGDGRGSIRSYGDWFLRLETPGFTGVGIHGSTNNEVSVPGRDSEGCIRLRDADLIVLHDRFAAEGQKVIIKGFQQGKLPFELKAQQALGDRYVAPVMGNKAKNLAAPAPDAMPDVPEEVTPPEQPGEPSAEAPAIKPSSEKATDAVNPSLGDRPSDKELEQLTRRGGIKPSSAPTPDKKKEPAKKDKKK